MWAGGHVRRRRGRKDGASERARATGGRRPGPASQPLLSSLLWFAFFGSSAVVGVAVGVWWCWPEAKLARRPSIYSRHAHGTRMRQPGLRASACQRRDDVTSSVPVWASGQAGGLVKPCRRLQPESAPLHRRPQICLDSCTHARRQGRVFPSVEFDFCCFTVFPMGSDFIGFLTASRV